MSKKIEETVQENKIEENKSEESPKEEKKQNSAWKFIIYFVVILLLTGLALFFSLYKDFDGVISALAHADWRYLLIILGIVSLSYLIDGLIIFTFVRLYTRNYYYHRGLAVSMVGAFYSAVTPGSSGGQAMQIYTMKKQGVAVSNSASIMIMSFILYQTALIIIGIVGVAFKWNLIMTIGKFEIDLFGFQLSIPAIPFTLLGFAINVSVILLLFLMSYSHKFHNFILNFGIGFLGKIRIIRNVDEKREELRIQVENFKIELKRLFTNIPVTVLVLILYLIVLILRFSIPFFAGLALDGYGYLLNFDGSLVIATNPLGPVLSTGQANFGSFWNAVFLSSYHQMVSGLIPIPGAAGVSEYFFNTIFSNFFVSKQVTTAAQIIWRFSSYHVVLLISGIVSASYRVTPKVSAEHANRKTYVNLQLETYSTRKASVETLYETAALSRKEMRERIAKWNKERQARRKKAQEKRKQNQSKKNGKTSKKSGEMSEEEYFDEL